MRSNVEEPCLNASRRRKNAGPKWTRRCSYAAWREDFRLPKRQANPVVESATSD
jgi:hypothetical protein